MGLWDKAKGQLRSVIEWNNPSEDIIFYRWSSDGDEIKNASKLIVNPGQGCIFVYEGKVEAFFEEEGIVELKTANIPFWTTISKFMQKFESEHKVGIYFYKKTQILNQKWGTPSVIKYMDPKYNFEVGLRAYGNYAFQINDPGHFFCNIMGVGTEYTTAQFRDVMGSKIIEPLTDYFAEAGFGYSDIDKERQEISAGIKERLLKEFSDLGFEIIDFKIEGTSFDDNTMKRINRIADMTAEAEALKRVGMNYADQQKLEAMKLAAQNEGGGAGLGMGMGAGMGMGQMMAGMMGSQQSSPQVSNDSGDPTAKLKKLKEMMDMELISKEEFEQKKKEILGSL
ncbi:MAG TPA: SPFH domain-containing protein [Spirochaetota bacterium]|nr:SPFH domain-containing protein [Spirochaetota bacterium]